MKRMRKKAAAEGREAARPNSTPRRVRGGENSNRGRGGSSPSIPSGKPPLATLLLKHPVDAAGQKGM
jgi:hypothetical protein